MTVDVEAFREKWKNWEDAALDPQTMRADFFDVLTALASLQSWAMGAKVDIEGLQTEIERQRPVIEAAFAVCDCPDNLQSVLDEVHHILEAVGALRAE